MDQKIKYHRLVKWTKLINSFNEIYEACRHKLKFHRFFKLNNLSADEGSNPEKSLCKENAENMSKKENTKREEKKRKRKMSTRVREFVRKIKRWTGVLIYSPISV